MSIPSGAPRKLELSYLALRTTVGTIGIALPWVLATGGWPHEPSWLQPSLSAYYYTGMRNIFVAILFFIGVFLAVTRGYDWKDELAGWISGPCAIGVALFPTTRPNCPALETDLIGKVHYGCAAVLFVTLGLMSLCLFTKSSSKVDRTDEKKKRNVVYKICGIAILVSITCIGVLHFFAPEKRCEWPHSEFWLETIAVEAFGFAWLTKGETIIKDA